MKSSIATRYAVWGVMTLLTTGIVYLLARPAAVDVETITADLGVIESVITCDGKVRLRQKVLISLPVASVYTPSAIEPGDPVHRGDVMGRYKPVSLDERTEHELLNKVLALGKLVEVARTTRDGLKPQVEQLKLDADRQQRLVRIGAVAQSSWEQAFLRYNQAATELRSAELRVLQSEYESQALASMLNTFLSTGLPIRSPAKGVVLRKFVEQERILPLGQTLYELGTFDSVEIVAELLSADAALIRAGMSASIDIGAAGSISASVQRIEPAAFTKLSALGIEEQRVNIVIVSQWPVRLGDAYKVRIEITLWKADRVLRIPSNAIAVRGADTSVFVVDEGRAVQKSVKLGRRSKNFVEIHEGIKKGTTVIVNPPSSLQTDSRVSRVD
jgi:HlyD family secretion protein